MTTQANPTPKVFNVAQAFGVPQLNVEIEGFDQPWDTPVYKTPAKMVGYKWRADLLQDLIIWWYSGDRALKLIGETGTGKTELIKQFCATLNLPLLMTSANPRTEAYQLIGGNVPTPEGFAYRDSLVGIAARYGVLCMIDEYNVLDPGEATGLNAFLEGNPYTVPETGETIVPHPNFRIVVTQNPKSAGYKGRNTQDIANDDRFIDLNVPYMSAADEVDLVASEVMRLGASLPEPPTQDAAKDLATNAVKFANAVRARYMGSSNKDDALPCTMSTRNVLRWVRWTMGSAQLMEAGHSPAHYALRRALTNRQRPEVTEALHKILEAVVGEREVIA
jgi:cobaltochelatase CobS